MWTKIERQVKYRVQPEIIKIMETNQSNFEYNDMKIVIIIFLISWLTIQTCGLKCFKCEVWEPSVYSLSEKVECVANPDVNTLIYSKTCEDPEYCTWIKNNDGTKVLNRGCSKNEQVYPRTGCKGPKCGCDSGDNCNDYKIPSQVATLSTLQCIDCFGLDADSQTDCLTTGDIKYSKPCLGKGFACITTWDKEKTIVERFCHVSSTYKGTNLDGSCLIEDDGYSCACKTDNCNDEVALNESLVKYPEKLHCYQCANYGDNSAYCRTPTDEFLKPCPNNATIASSGIAHYCTTEVYGNLVRRKCESDLPSKTYANLDGCHEHQDFEYAGLTKYCACNTNKCNNETVSSNVDKFEGLSLRILIVLILFLIKVVIL